MKISLFIASLFIAISSFSQVQAQAMTMLDWFSQPARVEIPQGDTLQRNLPYIIEIVAPPLGPGDRMFWDIFVSEKDTGKWQRQQHDSSGLFFTPGFAGEVVIVTVIIDGITQMPRPFVWSTWTVL